MFRESQGWQPFGPQGCVAAMPHSGSAIRSAMWGGTGCRPRPGSRARRSADRSRHGACRDHRAQCSARHLGHRASGLEICRARRSGRDRLYRHRPRPGAEERGRARRHSIFRRATACSFAGAVSDMPRRQTGRNRNREWRSPGALPQPRPQWQDTGRHGDHRHHAQRAMAAWVKDLSKPVTGAQFEMGTRCVP